MANGIPVIDADVVAHRFGTCAMPSTTMSKFVCDSVSHEVLRKGMGGRRKVVAVFGEKILQEDGEVERKKLGLIVFSDPAKRQVLNRLLAPYSSSGIFQKTLKLWLKGYKVIVLDIPQLFEAKMDKWTKPIIVVWVDPDTQLHRLMKRDRTSETDARNRIDAQMPLDLKGSKADIVVIDNSEQFCGVLSQVTRPLTWTELALSRKGATPGSTVIILILQERKLLFLLRTKSYHE